MPSDKFHQAAREDFLELLRTATRRDCNQPDEDGMTPTLWAGYCGHLDVLRILVGRGGNPDRCDCWGGTALHHSAACGHLHCAMFLVSFGVNLWSMDNDFHTPLDRAAMNNHMEVVRFLDDAICKQALLNGRGAEKQKERSFRDAEQRAKHFIRSQYKSDRKQAKNHVLSSIEPTALEDNAETSSLKKTLRRLTLRKKKTDKPPNVVSKKSDMSRSLSMESIVKAKAEREWRLQYSDEGMVNGGNEEDGDFRVREIKDGNTTIRSLSGIRHDSEVLFVSKGEQPGERVSPSPSSHPHEYRRLAGFSRTTSKSLSNVSDHHRDRSCGEDSSGYYSSRDPSTNSNGSTKLFERPGFGTLTIRSNNGTSRQLSSALYESNSIRLKGETYHLDSVVYDEPYAALTPPPPHSMSDSEASSNQIKTFADNLDKRVAIAKNMDDFIAALGLNEYKELLESEKLDINSLMLCSDEDLRSIALPLGPRRLILYAAGVRKQNFAL